MTTTADADETVNTVETGETLSAIAREDLGDANAWPKIFEHNKNRVQPDGRLLTDPDLIYPGWELVIPGEEPVEEPPPEDEPPADDPPAPIKPPPQLDDQDVDDNPGNESESSSSTDTDGAAPAGLWWAGGFVATGFGAGIVLWVRRARHRVHQYEKRTGCSGPRIRLHEPLGELEPATGPSTSAAHDAAQPAMLGTAGDETPVPIAQARAGGLGLTGPGAEAAARAAIAAALTADDQDATSTRYDVITTTTLLAQLLEADQTPSLAIHRLWTYPDTETALRALTRDLNARTRDPDITASVLAVLDDDADRAVLTSVMEQGEPLGVTGLVLGDWPTNTISVDTNGNTNVETPTRCHTLTPVAFAATLSTLDDIAEAFSEPVTPPSDDLWTDGDTDTYQPDTAPLTKQPSALPEPEPASAGENTPAATTPDQPDISADKPQRLWLLGEFALAYRGEPVHIRRTKSRELLAYLATQQHPAGLDTLMETIVPETAFNKSRDHFNAVVTYARKDLRVATGAPNTTMFILYNNGGYRLDPDWFTSDLADFDHHITTTDPAAKTEHLHTALDLYTGEVATDLDSESTWLYPIRAHYADHAHTACCTLAQHAASHAGAAIDLLELAITINPYNETAYTQLINVHTEHGNPDAAITVKRRLTTALTHINATPSRAH